MPPPTITPLLVAELLVEGERWPVCVDVIDHPDARARSCCPGSQACDPFCMSSIDLDAPPEARAVLDHLKVRPILGSLPASSK
jgi:hypothetical protein